MLYLSLRLQFPLPTARRFINLTHPVFDVSEWFSYLSASRLRPNAIRLWSFRFKLALWDHGPRELNRDGHVWDAGHQRAM